MQSASPSRGGYSYQDYLAWPDDERWELVAGEAFAMTPAPSFLHQQVVTRLAAALVALLRGHACIPCVSPVDVVLSEEDVVQPDVVVICDRSKITPRGVRGAPDVVFEVLSPSTSLRDRRTKRDLYERHAVAEYVLVYPEDRVVEHLTRGEEGTYGRSRILGPEDSLSLKSLGGLSIPLGEVFEGLA